MSELLGNKTNPTENTRSYTIEHRRKITADNTVDICNECILFHR